jgi:GT2 family glycosyltransferase
LPEDTLPFCSVIVPTRDRPEQLAFCVEALEGLDYPRDRFEVIVVDDIDADGPASARNRGALRARGDLLAFTDDDCVPARDWLRRLAARADADPGCALGGQTLNAVPANPYSEASERVVGFAYAYYNADPDHARFFAANNLAVPAEEFHQVGGFDESFATAEDREFCDRWLRLGRRLVYVPEALVRHGRPLDLPAFLRRHFGYGRGAFRFHWARSPHVAASVRRELGFYGELPGHVRELMAESGRRAPTLGALLILWQLANAAGFAWEALGLAPSRPSRP